MTKPEDTTEDPAKGPAAADAAENIAAEDIVAEDGTDALASAEDDTDDDLAAENVADDADDEDDIESEDSDDVLVADATEDIESESDDGADGDDDESADLIADDETDSDDDDSDDSAVSLASEAFALAPLAADLPDLPDVIDLETSDLESTDRDPDPDLPPATGNLRWIEPAGLDRFDGVDLVEELTGRDLTDAEQSWASAFNDHVDGAPRTLVLAAAAIRAAAADSATLPPADDPQALTNRLIEACDPQTRQALRILESLRPRGVEGTGAAAFGLEHLAILTAGASGAAGGADATTSLDDLQAALGAALVDTGLVEVETDAYGVRRYRVADGVVVGENAAGWIPAVAQELAAWASRVGPLEASGEAEAAIAAVQGAVALERLPVARMLARAMAPALAATLRWDQWGTVLEAGRDASLRATAGADAGYFHHELAIRALCLGDSETAAFELAAAVKAYVDAGDERRGGAARRAATVAGIPLPDALLAVPDPKGVLAKRYKGAVVGGGGPKKVTVGTASAMVLFGVAAVSLLVVGVGGGGGSGGAGGGSVVVAKQDTGSTDQANPFYAPLNIPGALPPVVEVPKATPAAPVTGNVQGPQQPAASSSRTFIQPTKPVVPSTIPPGSQLQTLQSYSPPPLVSSSVAPPSSTTPILPTLPPVSSLPSIPVSTTPATTPPTPPPTTPPTVPSSVPSSSPGPSPSAPTGTGP